MNTELGAVGNFVAFVQQQVDNWDWAVKTALLKLDLMEGRRLRMEMALKSKLVAFELVDWEKWLAIVDSTDLY